MAAVRVLALAAVASLALAAFRARATSVRLFTWTALLYAALAMPLLQSLLPMLPIPALAFLSIQPARPTSHVTIVRTAYLTKTDAAQPSDSQANPSVTPTVRAQLLATVAAGIYLAIALILLTRFSVGLAMSRRLRSASQTISETRLTKALVSAAQHTGLSTIPRAAESARISVPITMGVLQPAVLLPITWREWEDAKLNAILAHELSHVARRDTLTQRLALLHRAIFWFSPLAWWLNRHLANLVEQASDEAALAHGADRKAYAQMLLSFFEALQGAPGRVRWQGVAMATSGATAEPSELGAARRAARCAEERLEKILTWNGAVTMNLNSTLKKSVAVVVLALAVPVVYLSAAASPAHRNAEPNPANTSASAPPQDAPSSASAAEKQAKKSATRRSHSYTDRDTPTFIISTADNDSLTMSGSRIDAEEAESLKKKIHGDFIWFRHDGKSYIIRDPETVQRAKSFWAPQEELGRQQEALGKQQEALGEKQEALGQEMEQIHVNVPDMSEQLAKLQAELKQLGSSATQEQLGKIESEIGDLQSKLGGLQSQAGEQQSKLSGGMNVLGEQQEKLGKQQSELGRQQSELAEKASRQMKQLLEDSVSKGTAQPEPLAEQ